MKPFNCPSLTTNRFRTRRNRVVGAAPFVARRARHLAATQLAAASVALLLGSREIRADEVVLDTSFSDDGWTASLFGGFQSEANAVAIDSNGRIVVAGYTVTTPEDEDEISAFLVARYTANGALDATFGTGGFTATPFNGGSGEAKITAIAIDSSGRIVATGNLYPAAMALARYTPEGLLDPTFDGDGKLATSLNGAFEASAIVIDSSGRILVAGRAAGAKPVIARFLEDGTADVTFDGDGMAVLIPPDVSAWTPTGLALDSPGRIVVAGSGGTWPDLNFLAMRLLSDGTLDPSFSGDGSATTSIGSSQDYANALAIDAADRILLAGYTRTGQDDTDFALIRYDSTGELDSTFDGDGKATATLGGYDYGFTIALDAGGRIVIGGYSNMGATSYDLALLRFTPGGTLDTTFDEDGKAALALTSSEDSVRAIVLDANQRIVTAGGTGGEMVVARSGTRVCGNGLIETSESCDDGNPSTGDCLEAAGAICRAAVAGGCDVAETCTGADATCPTDAALADGTPCGGSSCTQASCTAGACSGAVALPRSGCRTVLIPLKSKLKILDKVINRSDQIQWSWKVGEATTLAEFAAPTDAALGSDYDLCVFDESVPGIPQVISHAHVAAGAGWTAVPRAVPSSYEFTDRWGSQDGITSIKLKPGVIGKPSIDVKGKGFALDTPLLPLVPPIRIQLQVVGGVCFEATFEAAGMLVNTASTFVGRGH